MFLRYLPLLPHRRRQLETAVYCQKRSVTPFLRQHFGKSGIKLKVREAGILHEHGANPKQVFYVQPRLHVGFFTPG